MITDINGGFELNNGLKMPYLGLGVFKTQDGPEVIQAVKWALDHGYRHIDTAAIYRNERGVGQAIKESQVPREDIFLVSKVWNADQGYQSTLDAYEKSLERLQTEYLDLYLIHWPVKGKYKETWRAMEKLYSDGKVKSIGVSNFLQHHLEDIMEDGEFVPMVNQVEFHPKLVQQDLLNFCNQHKIIYEAWSPLMRGEIFDIDEMQEIANKYDRSIAQIVLRWNIQKGVVTIPKTVRQERIIENAKLFDFSLSQEDMEKIDKLDTHSRIGPDPDNFDF